MVVGQLNKIAILFLLIIFSNQNLNAVEFKGKFIQGSFILGKTNPGAKVKIDEKNVLVTDDGYFAFGIGRDRKNDVTIRIIKDQKLDITVKKVFKRKYKIQRIDGLPEKKVTPPKELYERIKKENKIIANARAIESNLTFFKNKFIVPVENSIITGVYGSQRILNGKPKWPHYGLDFAAKEGTEVKAMLNGTVTMAEKDLFYTGGTLIFDHGHGISTLYMHMQKLFVKKGQKVKQGDIIGTVGATGRATGPHLDVRLNWFGVRLDPATVLDLN
jgi:murein DD-endopeptidase MepM/ murein hydrolase activator NlpD